MDVQAGLIYMGVVIISAVVILLVSIFGIKEKSYEEAIAEQRKFPDSLLLGRKEKVKEKRHKNKAGKKVKEKKEERGEKEEKQECVQFEEIAQILSPDLPLQEGGKGSKKKNKSEKIMPILINKDEPVVIIDDLSLSQPPFEAANHFDNIRAKDDLELMRSHSGENFHRIIPLELLVTKSPKDTPTKLKKNNMVYLKKKDDVKENKVEINTTHEPHKNTKDSVKEPKQIQKDTSSKETKNTLKETAVSGQHSSKESKRIKKKNDILSQIGGDKDGVNVSLLMPLVQKAELSRSEIQVLIDQLLNKQLDNPSEHSEWTEGRTDPVIKLKKQLAEKEKSLLDEREASIAFQNKLKELRVEFNSERSRLSVNVRHWEEALNAKITETQTLHTRMQHILESHAAEKQGFARQIEQLQAKVNEDAAIIIKMQEDQGQTQGHMQQELLAQRKQLEVQFAQMRENENALKAQLAQKHVEIQELQTVNVSISQELQATCETTSAEIDMLRQQLAIMQEQLMHSEGQMQHFKEESRRVQTDLDHRLKSVHRHEQELHRQVNSLQSELNLAKSEASEASSLKSDYNKVRSELRQVKLELSVYQNENETEAVEITTLNELLSSKQDEIQETLTKLSESQTKVVKLETELKAVQMELNEVKTGFAKSQDIVKIGQNDLKKCQEELKELHKEINRVQEEFSKTESHQNFIEEIDMIQINEKKMVDVNLQIARLQEENDKLSSQVTKLELAAERHENGIEEKLQKTDVQNVIHMNLLEEKEIQLATLRIELSKEKTELDRIKMQVETLRSEASKQHSHVQQLQDDLDAQRTKNNELRIKNWKVMEALSATEFHSKSNQDKSIDSEVQTILKREQESMKSLLQRLFPDIKVTEKSYDRWISVFEETVSISIPKLRKKVPKESNQDLEKQNKSLQGLVTHYKQIIDDTEGMLVKLQNHIESVETRWQAQLRQKDSEVATLRLEISRLQGMCTEGFQGAGQK